MGKFLRDKDGELVAIDGGLVLEKTLDRKPKDCEQCGFNKWVKKDKIFIIQRNQPAVVSPLPTFPQLRQQAHRATAAAAMPQSAFGNIGGSMEWICPDCALQRGLPPEHYHKNFYAVTSPQSLKLLEQCKQRRHQGAEQKQMSGCSDSGVWNIFDLTGYMCS
jgi:hypothetical protein